MEINLNKKMITSILVFLLMITACAKENKEINKHQTENSTNGQNILEEQAEEKNNSGIKNENAQKEENSPIALHDNMEVKVPGDLFLKSSLEIRRLVSGSWSSFKKESKNKRILSWGEVPVIDDEYLLFDFLVKNPLIIIGGSEGGPGFDQQLARIVGMIQDDNSFLLFYHVIESGFKTDHEILSSEIKKVLIHYSPHDDTLQIDPSTMISGTLYSEGYKFFRISEKLE